MTSTQKKTTQCNFWLKLNSTQLSERIDKCYLIFEEYLQGKNICLNPETV